VAKESTLDGTEASMRLWTACGVGLLLFGGMAQAQDVAPLGGEFQINAFTTEISRSIADRYVVEVVDLKG